MTASLPQQPQRPPTFAEALRFWLKLGFISFGGPTGQIAIMHTELVEKRRWVSEARFLHALNFCMVLPGPEAQQLAVYIGWLLHRTKGGIVAGALFVLPSAAILWGLSWGYVTHGGVPVVAAVFDGLKPAVVAIVAAAVLRIGRRALRSNVLWGIALASFLALHFRLLSFPLLIAAAAAVGWVGGRVAPSRFQSASGHGAADRGEATEGEGEREHVRRSLVRAVRVTLTCLALWWTPIALLGLWLGWRHAVVQEGLFFSKAAMVTFGGAYAVLPYVAQRAVETFGWLSKGQMLDGLGLAESTPGPLIMVLQFVGFVGGWNAPGPLSPLAAATIGAAITTWATFLPCFLWIFLGAPHIEQLRSNRSISAALTAVTAAVVGVVLNLAVTFGAVVLQPATGIVNWFGVAVTVAVFAGMQRWKWGTVPVVLGAGTLGVLWLAARTALER